MLALSEKLNLPPELYEEFRSFGAKKGHRPKNSTPKDLFAGFDEGIALINQVCAEDIKEFGYKAP